MFYRSPKHRAAISTKKAEISTKNRRNKTEAIKMSIKTDIVEAPLSWNAYLIYGDCSGMDESDIAACDKYFAGMQVLDCNPESARFTWSADLFGSTSKGDTVCEYTVVV